MTARKTASKRKDAAPSLRDRLNERTRELIVDALIAQLGDSGAFEFSFFEVARRAGVSVRTVYRHFPTREALFDAMSARVNEQVGFHEYPRSVVESQALVRALYPAFDAQAPLIVAQMQTSLGRQLRSHARRDRTAAIQRIAEEVAPDLDPARRKHLAGVIGMMVSSDLWRRMREELEMTGAESGEAAAWALGVLFDALARENQAAARTAAPKKGKP